MTTEKLYYEDCHLTSFTARVTDCRPAGDRFRVLLDRTAFYPEGGGQPCDLGTLDDAAVADVQEEGDEIAHYTTAPLAVGACVTGTLDGARRFDLMQQHSGEHMVSGVVHRRWGWHNVGFHMGTDAITIDFDGPILPEALPEIEAEVNAAVWRDLPLHIWYPTPEELPTVPYRTKRALPWPVRVVEIPGVDLCACCGVHVARTGEIGLVKLLSCVKFRQGVRIEMLCGGRAMALLCAVFDQNRQVSQAFSAKMLETGAAARAMNDALAAEKFRATGLERRLFDRIAAGCRGAGNVLRREDGLSGAALRELADRIAGTCGGTTAVFSGSDEEGYNFCLADRTADTGLLCKAMTGALRGRGGGRGGIAQGSVQASWTAISAFFADLWNV